MEVEIRKMENRKIIGKPAYAKASADNSPPKFYAGGPTYAKASVDSPSWLTRKTTGEPSWLVDEERINMELEAPSIKEASSIEASPIEISSVVYSCINFPISNPSVPRTSGSSDFQIS